ncbi:MAG TPA: DUF4124 domain-containing protein [Rudaea sp.]|jgi:hypothetical protein|uniref:DUF4124 domain-containing protein n=1 Tax=Rudaea sp. TaxID=2136325 RepID=UPI002F934C27
MSLMQRLLIALAIVATSLPLLAANTGQTRYKWRDAHGGLHYTDTLPAEALQNGYDVVDKQGYVVKHVDRARTDEERKADKASAATQASERKQTQEQVKADQQLVSAYASEQDLQAAQQSRLDVIDETIKNVQLSQSDQEKSLSEQLAHAASLERNGKPVPLPVQQQIEVLRKNIYTQKAFIARKQQERVDAGKKSEAEIAHYREVRARQSGATQP